MADVLNDEKVSWTLQRIFNTFDLRCVKVGPSCNAGRPRPFTKAECEVKRIDDWGKPGISFDFHCLFGTGFDLISDLKHGIRNYEELDSHFKKAFEILDNFMKTKSMHEKSIAALLKNGDNLTETGVTTALAEHLLSKLAPGQSYTIDKKCRGKVDMCKCGCQAKINFGDTGIGHEEVWHGFVDIMFSSHDGIEPEAAAVIQNVPVPESDTEPVTKKYKQAPEEGETCIEDSSDEEKNQDSDKKDDSPGGKCPAEVKIDLDNNGNTDDQTIAQAIVFSLLQKQRHPDFKSFLIPTIVISSTKFKLLMYDAENDILLRSRSINLFVEQGSSEILDFCIIILWMVFHYRIFSSDLKKYLRVDLNKLKSGFLDKIPAECVEIYKSKLKSCVASFPRVLIEGQDTEIEGGNFANYPRFLDFLNPL